MFIKVKDWPHHTQSFKYQNVFQSNRKVKMNNVLCKTGNMLPQVISLEVIYAPNCDKVNEKSKMNEQ